MDNNKRIEKLKQKVEDFYHQLAVKMSKSLRKFKTKEERSEAHRLLPKDVPISVLKKLYEVSIENEDYETSEVVHEYLTEKGEEII